MERVCLHPGLWKEGTELGQGLKQCVLEMAVSIFRPNLK